MELESEESKFTHNAKRKWQIALRRYVLENSPAQQYAPYFGIDRDNLRKWIELQFTKDQNWENHGKEWQFDHIIPQTYFDFRDDADMKLCWNFINIRVEPIQHNKNRGGRIDILGVKKYFETIYTKCNYSICKRMLEKIESIELSNIESTSVMESFLIENKELIEQIETLSPEEFYQYNTGTPIADILLERALLKKFGQ